MPTKSTVIGIDPAPVTPSRIWTEEGLKVPLEPSIVRKYLKDLLEEKANYQLRVNWKPSVLSGGTMLSENLYMPYKPLLSWVSQ